MSDSKKKKSVIIISVIAVILLTCTAVFAIVPAIKNVAISKKSPNDYLKYTVTEKSSVSEEIADSIDNFKKILSGDVDISLNAQVERGEGLAQFLELTGIATQAEIKEKTGWFDTFELSLVSARDHGLSGLKADTSLNGKDIVSADSVLDTSSFAAYATINEISSESLRYDLNDSDPFLAAFALVLSRLDELSEALPDEDATERIIDRYLDIFFSGLSSVTKEEGTLKVGDISQKCTVTTVNLPYDDMYAIAMKILETAKDDEELKSAVSPLMTFAKNTVSDYLEAQNASPITKAVVLAALEPSMIDFYLGSAKTSLEAADATGILRYEDEVLVKLWTDSNHEIIGISYTVNDRERFAARSASKGKSFNDEVVIQVEDVPITVMSGSGTVSRGKKNGVYAIGINSEYIKAELRDFDIEKWTDDGQLTGTIILEVGKNLPESVLNSNFSEDIAQVIKDCSLTLNFEHSIFVKSSSEVILSHKKTPVLGVNFTAGLASGGKLSVPEKSYCINSGEFGAYMKNANPDKVISNLRSANVPDEILTFIGNGFASAKADTVS